MRIIGGVEKMKDSIIQNIIEFKDNYYRILFKKFFKEGSNDIFPTDQMAMLYLWYHGDTSLKKMSLMLNLEKGSLTTVARRLEEQGLIDRVNDETDKRSILLSINGKGRSFVTEWLKDFGKYVEGLLEPYTEFERESIVGAISLLNAFLRQMDNE